MDDGAMDAAGRDTAWGGVRTATATATRAREDGDGVDDARARAESGYGERDGAHEGMVMHIAAAEMAHAMYARQMMASMAPPEAMRAAYERQNAALATMGPQMMAAYAAYVTYVQSQAQNARAYAGMLGAAPHFGGVYAAMANGAAALDGEAMSARAGRGGHGARKGGKGRDNGARNDGGAQALRVRTAKKQKPKVKPQKICTNCKSTETPFWRKDKDGGWLCNACGLYAAKNGAPRPVLLWKRSSATASENDGSDKTNLDKIAATPSGSGDAAENKSKQDAQTSPLKTSCSGELTTTTTPATTESDEKASTEEAKLDEIGRDAE